MHDLLTQAIKARKYISFTYSGLQREGQPAALGTSRTGKAVLRCYQTAGGHIQPGHEWDLLELSGIHDLKVLEKTFPADPPGYKKGDKHMTLISAEL